VIPLINAIRERPWIFLILGGRGPQEETIRIACSSLGNVFFPGYIKPDEVPFFTALADIIYYCYNPQYAYASFNAPNKLYEALAAGKAILASNIGGEITKVVQSVKCGILISQVNTETIGCAIDQLAQESVRCPMQDRAYQAGLTTYNWAIAKKRLASTYSELLNRF
jgi:glycosyltransferase involved in cell wall biosynthesis